MIIGKLFSKTDNGELVDRERRPGTKNQVNEREEVGSKVLVKGLEAYSN